MVPEPRYVHASVEQTEQLLPPPPPPPFGSMFSTWAAKAVATNVTARNTRIRDLRLFTKHSFQLGHSPGFADATG